MRKMMDILDLLQQLEKQQLSIAKNNEVRSMTSTEPYRSATLSDTKI
jgi:hypothetical protein